MNETNKEIIATCVVFSSLTILSTILLFIIYFKREKWTMTTSLNIQLCITSILHSIAYFFWSFQVDNPFCRIQAAYEPASFSGMFSFCTIIVFTAYIMFAKPEAYTSHTNFFKIWTSVIVWCIVIFVFCLNYCTDSFMVTSIGQCRGGRSVSVAIVYFIVIFSSIVLAIVFLILLVKDIYPALKLSDSSSHKKYYFKRMIVIIVFEILILVLFCIFIFLESDYQRSDPDKISPKTSTSIKALVIIESIVPLIVVSGFCYNEKTIEDMKILFCCKNSHEELDHKLVTEHSEEKLEEIKI